MKSIYIVYKKAEKVNMKEYYEKYDKSGRIDYAMAFGSPILIRIEGTVTYLNDLPTLTASDEDRKAVLKFLRGSGDDLQFRWNRDKKYGNIRI